MVTTREAPLRLRVLLENEHENPLCLTCSQIPGSSRERWLCINLIVGTGVLALVRVEEILIKFKCPEAYFVSKLLKIQLSQVCLHTLLDQPSVPCDTKNSIHMLDPLPGSLRKKSK